MRHVRAEAAQLQPLIQGREKGVLRVTGPTLASTR